MSVKKQPERGFREVILVDTNVQRIGVELIGKQTIFKAVKKGFSYATNGNRMRIILESY
jgi:hypothetical protein